MKKVYFICALLGLLNISLMSQNNYLIRLNDTVYEVSMGNEHQILFNGEILNIELKQKDTLLYDSDFYRLQYPKGFQVSEVVIEEGVKQIVLMTAEGSGYIVQSYSGVNPVFMSEMMLHELTKESVHYGFKLERKDYSRTLKSGHELNILKAVLSYRDEENVYEVAALGERDEGILVATVIMNNHMNELLKGRELIRLMWNSLEYKTQVKPVEEERGLDEGFFKNLPVGGMDENVLFVVDGKPMDEFYNLDPDQIESIKVLKDSSALEIYGDRGKNGVVLIELKKEEK